MITRKDNTPGGLAHELVRAREVYEAKRASVIERGTERVREIAALQAELDREKAELQGVVSDAQSE